MPDSVGSPLFHFFNFSCTPTLIIEERLQRTVPLPGRDSDPLPSLGTIISPSSCALLSLSEATASASSETFARHQT